METSSIETGSSARIIFGLNASALASTTRCLCPPDSMCGYFFRTSSAGSSFTSCSTSMTLFLLSSLFPIL